MAKAKGPRNRGAARAAKAARRANREARRERPGPPDPLLPGPDDLLPPVVRYVRADRELDDEGEPVDVALLDESPPVYDVEVRRYEPDPQDPQDVAGWSAEGGVRDASVGTDFEFTASLAELLGWVQEEVDALRQRRAELRVVCTLDGSEAEMQAVAQEEGAALPR